MRARARSVLPFCACKKRGGWIEPGHSYRKWPYTALQWEDQREGKPNEPKSDPWRRKNPPRRHLASANPNLEQFGAHPSSLIPRLQVAMIRQFPPSPPKGAMWGWCTQNAEHPGWWKKKEREVSFNVLSKHNRNTKSMLQLLLLHARAGKCTVCTYCLGTGPKKCSCSMENLPLNELVG